MSNRDTGTEYPRPTPARSILYCMEPIGIGTPYVESLTGYISRLAEAHSVPVRTLVGKILAEKLGKAYLLQSCKQGGSRFYDRSRVINGMSKTALDILNALSDLTGRHDLNNLTMISWSDNLSPRELMKEYRAWCPLCLTQMSDRHVYEQLLWNVREVNFCPIHHISMEDVCPSCLHRSRPLTRNSRPGFCPRCNEWLGGKVHPADTDLISNEELQYNEWKAIQTAELLTAEPRGQSHIPDLIQHLVQQLCQSNLSQLADILAIPKVTLWDWRSGAVKPSLPQLLKVAHRLQISLRDMLTEDLIQPELYLLNHGESSKGQVHPRVRVNWIHIGVVLTEFAENDGFEHLSMQKVAERLEVNKRLLYVHFPDECKSIANRYKAFVEKRKCVRNASLESQVKHATNTLVSQGEYPSRRLVEGFCRNPALLRSIEAQNVWNLCKEDALSARTDKCF